MLHKLPFIETTCSLSAVIVCISGMADLVARLLVVKLRFCRITESFHGSGIFREISRIYFWSLTAEAMPSVVDPSKNRLCKRAQ